MKRFFSSRQRVALYLATNGHCARCGVVLEAGWHADHVIPHSKGGPTYIHNGQALCKPCNLKKGAEVMLAEWPGGFELREWQKEAFRRYARANQQDFLAVATPGAGKTNFALRVALFLLAESQKVDRVVVVCPSTHLRQQWADAAAKVGINLNPGWVNQKGARESADYHGLCVTYQAVASEPNLYRMHCKNSRTFVILDEIHHAGEERSWGDSLREAFELAPYRLLLSGTPFRSDNNKMPFVRYHNGISASDYEYGYGFALRDGVCRSVLFPSYEGRMEWLSGGVDSYSSSFQDRLPKAQASERLRVALNPENEWIQTVIGDADMKLSEIQQGHPEAAGLILAKDQNHARAIGALVKELTGHTPVVVVSEDKEASEEIKRFRNSRARWLVAVKMVSEGVDIPRLRVGVYATTTLTMLFFRQVIGRLLRVQGLEEESAFLYIPNVDELIRYAQEIKDEREHRLDEKTKPTPEGCETDERCKDEDLQPKFLIELSANAIPNGIVIDEDHITQDEISEARRLREGIGFPPNVEDAHIARLVRRLKGQQPTFSVPDSASKSLSLETPLYARKKQLRGVYNVKVRRYCLMTGEAFGKVHYTFYSHLGKKNLDECTEEDLLKMISWIEEWIRGAE